MNEVIKAIKERRSIRSYKPDQITDTQLNNILEASEYAASGMDKQETVMVAVQDKAIIEKMSKLNAEIMGADMDPFYGAPTVVVVFADSASPTYVEDGSLVIGSMMLAAFSEGVDSCWIHRAKETFETEFGKELKKEWGIDDSYVGVGNCILGFRNEELPAASPRKEGRIVKA